MNSAIFEFLVYIESLAPKTLSIYSYWTILTSDFILIALTFKNFLSSFLYFSIKRGKNFPIGWKLALGFNLSYPKLKGIGMVLVGA